MDRLTALDLSMLWPDDFGWRQDIGGLAILDGNRLLDAGERFRIDHVRTVIEARLHLVPRYRQLLHFPRRGLGWPLWVDAPRFDLADHVRVFPVPAPGDEAQLLQIVEQLRRRQLDRSRPLWQMWFLPGLPRERVAFFLKMHHTIADGVAGVATLGALTDTIPDPPVSPAPAWTPALEPSARELLDDNLRARLDGFGRTASACAHPVATMGHVRAAWPALRETFAEAWAPRSSLNRPIGSDRRLAVVRSRLDVVRRVAHTHDATINDALTTAIAGGFRDLLRCRGERVDGLVLRAYVPVSLHREQNHGEHTGVMTVTHAYRRDIWRAKARIAAVPSIKLLSVQRPDADGLRVHDGSPKGYRPTAAEAMTLSGSASCCSRSCQTRWRGHRAFRRQPRRQPVPDASPYPRWLDELGWQGLRVARTAASHDADSTISAHVLLEFGLSDDSEDFKGIEATARRR